MKTKRKSIVLDEDAYDRLKLYTNCLPNRHKQKISFSDAIRKLINFRERL